MSHNPLLRLAVPFWWDRAFLPFPCHQLGEHRRQFAQIGTDEFVGADGDGFWAFSVVTQDETRDTGDSGFLWV